MKQINQLVITLILCSFLASCKGQKKTDNPGKGIAKADRLTHVAYDLYDDGGSSSFFITTGKIKLKAGDVVKQELRFIDERVFRYLLGVQYLADGFTIPENPNSNISGNVLGFFSAHTSQTKTIVVY